MKITSTLCLCVFLLSCSSDKIPGDILSQEKMKAVLWDYIYAETYANDFLPKDSALQLPAERNRLQEQVFTGYKTDRATFYRSLKWYKDHDKLMTAMIDSLSAVKSREMEKLISKPLKSSSQ